MRLVARSAVVRNTRHVGGPDPVRMCAMWRQHPAAGQNRAAFVLALQAERIEEA